MPLVSAFLLWTRRAQLAAVQPRPAHWAGAAVVLLALVLRIAGRAGSLQVLGQLAFLIAIVGAVLWILGTGSLRIAWPAIAYLLLMVPIWDGLTEPLHWPFQNRSAALAVAMLQGLGIPALREGTFVELPGITLEVARACSGVNYLIAVVALGLPLSYLYLPTMWRRVALVAFALVIAAFSNSLRVMLIGVLAVYDVGSPLHGPFHILQGLFVAGVGYGALFAGLRMLTPAAPANRTVDVVAARPAARASWRLPRPQVAVLTVVLVGIGSGAFAKESTPVHLAASLEQLPANLGPWSWDLAAPPSAPREWPGADAELRRRYRRADGTSAFVYVAYFETQAQNKELATWRADALHRRSEVTTIEGEPGQAFKANFVHLEDRDGEALFWYELDEVQTSAVRTRLVTLWNTVAHGRSNGAVVMVWSAGAAVPLKSLAAHVRHEFASLLDARITTGQPAARVDP